MKPIDEHSQGIARCTSDKQRRYQGACIPALGKTEGHRGTKDVNGDPQRSDSTRDGIIH
jgi:hypothetical protein